MKMEVYTKYFTDKVAELKLKNETIKGCWHGKAFIFSKKTRLFQIYIFDDVFIIYSSSLQYSINEIRYQCYLREFYM